MIPHNRTKRKENKTTFLFFLYRNNREKSYFQRWKFSQYGSGTEAERKNCASSKRASVDAQNGFGNLINIKSIFISK